MQYWWTWFYFVLYLMGFFFIERFSGITSYHLISLAIDHQLPFNEWFVFFYYLWFPFIFFTFAYLFFDHKRDYLKMITFLYVGMTLFLVISLGIRSVERRRGAAPYPMAAFSARPRCKGFRGGKTSLQIVSPGALGRLPARTAGCSHFSGGTRHLPSSSAIANCFNCVPGVRHAPRMHGS